MPVNSDKRLAWLADVNASVQMYNEWYARFAPETYRSTRLATEEKVEEALRLTHDLRKITPEDLKKSPGVLPTLRMSTCPPIAVDRLVGLSGAPKNLVKCMEEGGLPLRMQAKDLSAGLAKIGALIQTMADPDIFPWLAAGAVPTDAQRQKAASVVADRLCMAMANPIIRNAQERRQLEAIKAWLEARQYREARVVDGARFDRMEPGTFSFRLNVPVGHDGATNNIPVDAVIMPSGADRGDFPLLIEAKSAGDFTNVNKRRKEEAQKIAQLRATYNRPDREIRFILFLCGYFDTGYLTYEAGVGIDWVWEHRIDDLAEFGL